MEINKEQINSISKAFKLFIIVPNYNHGKYLPKVQATIESLKDFKCFVLFIDDCSSDNSKKIINDICKKSENSKHFYSYIFNKKNLGVVNSTNQIIKYIASSYIYFFSADDEIRPSLLSKAVFSLEKVRGKAFFISALISKNIKKDRVISSAYPFPEFLNKVFPKLENVYLDSGFKIILMLIFFQYIPGGNTVIYSTDKFKKFYTLDDSYSALVDLFRNILMAFKYGFIFNAKILGTFVSEENSFSWRHRKSKSEFLKSLISFYLNEFNFSLKGLIVLLTFLIIISSWIRLDVTRFIFAIKFIILNPDKRLIFLRKIILLISIVSFLPFYFLNKLSFAVIRKLEFFVNLFYKN